MINKRILLLCVFLAFLILKVLPTYAATYSLRGKIINGSTQQPVNFALVIIQDAGIVANATQGNYYIDIPTSGTYNITVQSSGMQSVTTSVVITGDQLHDFILTPINLPKKGSSVVIRGEKDIQKVSRYTMTKKEIKDVPASFGDSLNSLSSLPGISRPFGIFGPLIIRGADPATNGYFIDDIPLYNPMHFGGLHSVINNDLIREIDVYSSSYPSQFSNSQAAIININTIDEVDSFGGFTDVGLISACVLIKTPITKTTYIDGVEKTENKGYFIAAGRIGYLALFIPLFYEYVLDQPLDIVPEYWDYQFKAKYFINSSNSLTLLVFGSQDKIKAILKEKYIDDKDDPYFIDANIDYDLNSHNVGVYYTFKPKESFSNTLMAYAAMSNFYTYQTLPRATASWARDIGIESRPYVFGVKDKLKVEWWKSHGELRAGVEFNLYKFKADGITLIPNTSFGGAFDPGNPNSFEQVSLDNKVSNKTIVHYVENKFTFGWITFVPGYHAEYLALTKKHVFDPRGALTIAFPTETTIGAAGGYYSCFLQTNGDNFNWDPNIANADYLKPQRSIHRAVSVEQKISDYTLRLEGFYNNFWDRVEPLFILGATKNYYNNRKLKVHGFEFMVKINDDSDQGLFGWGSYTYSQSKIFAGTISGVPYDPDRDRWRDIWWLSDYDQTHVIKIVLGYTYKQHTLSSKFQFYSITPHDPIIDGRQDLAYSDPNDPLRERWVPVHGKRNSARMSPSYQLDLRYSHMTGYKWGYVTWYFEIINATNHRGEDWSYDYRYDYNGENNPSKYDPTKPKNPKKEKFEGLAIIPNFGVEAKF
ncbi:MAG: TonB-dependent receptor [Leptospirales bacterium]|nr:TonB-dependent receptor [Leptospirales bacterium]